MYKVAKMYDEKVLALESDVGEYKTALEMRASNNYSMAYAPMDYIEENAKFCVVGITPGDQQARNAIVEYVRCRKDGLGLDDSLKCAKKVASFSGPMRKNLIAMLDEIGLNSRLQLSSCDELFSDDAELSHFTSVIRYPLFKNGENYTGSPSPNSVPFLTDIYNEYLIDEIQRVNDSSVWLPLGAAVVKVFQSLVESKVLNADRVLFGLPHPSGANAERINVFLGKKDPEKVSIRTNAQSILEAKAMLVAQV